MRWMRIILGICGLIIAAMPCRAATSMVFIEELETECYDFELPLLPAPDLAGASTVQLDLEQGKDGAFTRIIISKESITVEAITKEQQNPKLQLRSGVELGQPYRFTVMRRKSQLRLLCNDTLLYQNDVPRAKGTTASLLLGDGWTTLDDPHVQRLETVVFADNFMRSPDESNLWYTQSGEWKLRSAWDDDPHGNSYRLTHADHASNPFAWMGKSTVEKPALCTAGNRFWEDYTSTVAIFPRGNGAVGMLVNMTDDENGLLIRWSCADDRGPDGNRLVLCRYSAGKLTPLAEDPGGYVPGQWYRLAVSTTLAGVRVFVDGKERLTVDNTIPRRGGIGLYVMSQHGAIFDDVTVYGHSLQYDLLAEAHASRISNAFSKDRSAKMQEWASSISDWMPATFEPEFNLYQRDFYGDLRLNVTTKITKAKDGQLFMVLCGSGQDYMTGYRALIRFAGPLGRPSYTLYRNDKVVASLSGGGLPINEAITFRLWRIGAYVFLSVGGYKIIDFTDPEPLSGVRPGYSATGSFKKVSDALVIGPKVADYSFADAPVDWWIGDGTWESTVRWACSPTWSFLGGWSRGDAVLWNKRRFTGDQIFEAFFAIKMEYPREHDSYDDRYRDLAITICGNGKDPRSGYSAILGAPDAQGTPNRRTVLLRNGVEVASGEIFIPSTGRESASHREWLGVELRKKGAAVEVWALGKLAITYQDPEPIAGGIPAIWTSNNGIVISRTRIFFTQQPELWERQQVTLANPWYPEWMDVGKTLTLNFPGSWSTTGQPVHLEVKPRETPQPDMAAATIDGTTLTFAPKAPRDHWYQVNATDGNHQSASFHLSFPVFTPEFGRDDSRALVLYRFDEGEGPVVRDHSTVAPAADLQVPPERNWLPGKGLSITGTTPLTTAGSVGKLLAIRQKKACTIELWVSTTSIYPVDANRKTAVDDRWISNFLSWERDPLQRNLTVGQQGEFLTFCPQSTQSTDVEKSFQTLGFRTGLQHLLITWDGTTTRAYVNGEKVKEAQLPWTTEKWVADATLTLGNRSDGQRPYMGVLYLVAIHDRCFTDRDILRHYRCGPSGR